MHEIGLLGDCECGASFKFTLAQRNIKAGNAVIECKVADCETVWVWLINIFLHTTNLKLTKKMKGGQFHELDK